MHQQLSLNLSDTKETNKPKYSKTITLPDDEPMPDGEVIFYQNFFEELESDRFFTTLLSTINWRQNRIKIFGREVDVPRLEAWYGDEEKSYMYSGILMYPDAWTPTLVAIKEKVEIVTEHKFNSVLINLYRNGRDSVSWHSDDEPELGINPAIASVSFGATRRFQLRHKSNKDLETLEIALSHGSLLLMKGETQHFWKHQVPKTSRVLSERINLTFRVIK